MKNKYLKRLASVLVVTALAIGTLTGCASKNSETTNTGSDTASGTDTTAGTEETSGSGQAAGDTDTGSTDSTEKITIYAATGGAPRPFVYLDDNGDPTGHNIDLIKAIFAKLPQYDLQIQVTEFPSIFAGLDSDKYQIGVNNFGMNEERKEKYIFTDAIFSNERSIVATKSIDLSNVNSLADLAGKKFIGEAGVNQTTVVEKYNEANPDKQIEINYTEADLTVQLQDIQAGKYDFTLIDTPMYYGYFQPEFNLDLSEKVLASDEHEDSYLIVSKGHEQLAEDINAALKELVDDGTTKEINEKYFGKDYTPYYIYE
jgi:polar amino acid transport system substrate-binding protein